MQSRVLNGRYELLTPLGQGGMATVYRGRDLRLGRPVAIKVLHNYYAADDEFLQRFAHEAMSAANLSSHPNIVDVYDVGQDGDLNYIVMELIEGQDVKVLINKAAPLQTTQAINIAIQVAEGLDYAHRRGLVHRDVKPQNMLLTPDGQVRIADFGIAKSHLSTAVTQAGITFGTADYISPEQAQGLNATPQSDIYSLGIVLYEMLTGHLPFTADTPMAVAIQHIQKPPPPLRQWNPSVPPALEALVLRTIAKDQQQRPGSAKQFAQELRDFLAGRWQQTEAVPTPRPPHNRRPAPAPAVPQSYQPRRPAPRPQYVPPPPPMAVAPPARGGLGFGTLLLGLLLLGGLLALAYVAFSPTGSSLFNFDGGSVAGPVATESPPPSAQPTATPQPEPTGTPVPVVRVPNFVGQPEATVATELLPQLKLVRGFDPNNPALQPRFDTAARGTVIEQAPSPGSEVPEGTPVTVVISLGPLPNVVGQSFDAAQATLQEGGLTVQRQDAPSGAVQAGLVAGQNPPAGAALARGSTVSLTVSLGDVVAFPDVIANDTPIDRARQLVAAAGFNIVAEDGQGPERLANFASFLPFEVVSATANGQPIDIRGEFVPRGADVILAFRTP
ncbi:MAG: serine/threonine-protein kinase [Chloroflexi bacterium]|nr:MAG: serine/threonine-protein kinase [Chloroflexota bacterium]